MKKEAGELRRKFERDLGVDPPRPLLDLRSGVVPSPLATKTQPPDGSRANISGTPLP